MAVFYRIHESAVMAYTQPGGEVAELMRGIAVDARNSSRIFAPKRTGKLAGKIFAGNYATTGPYSGTIHVAANVKYAPWVHSGTPLWIYPKNHTKLKFKSNIPGRKNQFFIFKDRVHGQAANPFLAKGLAAAMAKFRAGG